MTQTVPVSGLPPRLTLLDACLKATGQSGGTIHQFLPRLSWRVLRGPQWRRMGTVYGVHLDGRHVGGWIEVGPADLPLVAIEPGMDSWYRFDP